jgi:hypothetical protein
MKTLIFAAVLVLPHHKLVAAGPPPVDLGSAARFTILSGASITTSGSGIINGDVGASPIAGSAIAVTQSQVNGTIFAVDSTGPPGSVMNPTLLSIAKGDLTIAYNSAAGRTPVPTGPNLNPGAGNIGGANLIPGLYKFTSGALITGANLTLTGSSDDVWIFQIATSLGVGSNIHVLLEGGAQPRNIFWQVGTSATIGTFAVFKGTIMADQAIIMGTGSTLDGRALAFTAGVTYNGEIESLPIPKVPVFTNISRASGGAVTVTLKTTPYYLLTLQTSIDMLPDSWTMVTTATPQIDIWEYTHPANLATGPKRFYRAFLTAFPAQP